MLEPGNYFWQKSCNFYLLRVEIPETTPKFCANARQLAEFLPRARKNPRVNASTALIHWDLCPKYYESFPHSNSSSNHPVDS